MADDSKNDANAQALVDALLPKLQEAVMGEVKKTLDSTEKAISDRMDGLADKNAELLGKLHQSKDGAKTLEEQVADLTAQIASQGKPKEITLTRTEARNPQAYRKAKAEAAEHGVPFSIVEDD